MRDEQSTEFLRLMKVCVDGSDVLRIYMDRCIISPKYGGSFNRFLSTENKHKFYHLWQPEFPCCTCSGNFNAGKKEMHNWIFFKLYEIKAGAPCLNKGPNSKNRNGTFRYCICKVLAKQTLTPHDLDISVVTFLLKQFFPLNPDIENFLTIRGKICHAVSTRSFPRTDLEDMWKTFTAATLSLAGQVDESTFRLVQKQTNMTKKYGLDKEEITKLIREISELTMENCQLDINNQTEVLDDVKKYVLSLFEKFEADTSDIKQGQAAIKTDLKDEGEKVRQHTSKEISTMKDEMGQRGSPYPLDPLLRRTRHYGQFDHYLDDVLRKRRRKWYILDNVKLPEKQKHLNTMNNENDVTEKPINETSYAVMVLIFTFILLIMFESAKYTIEVDSEYDLRYSTKILLVILTVLSIIIWYR